MEYYYNKDNFSVSVEKLHYNISKYPKLSAIQCTKKAWKMIQLLNWCKLSERKITKIDIFDEEIKIGIGGSIVLLYNKYCTKYSLIKHIPINQAMQIIALGKKVFNSVKEDGTKLLILQNDLQ